VEALSPQQLRQLALDLMKGPQSLKELGYDASDIELAECYRRVTSLADESKQVRARDLMAIAHEVIRRKAAAAASETSSAA